MSNEKDLGLSPQGIPVAQAIPLKGPLKMLADHMTRSQQMYAPLTITGAADVTEFEAFRRQLVAKVEKEAGVHISFTHLAVKILAQSLRQHPILNSTLTEDKILILAEINVGIAAALESGFLIVPVIKGADRKSIIEIAREGAEITERARQNRLTLQDVTGGTFTLSNAGALGIRRSSGILEWSTPIITVPQSAILATGAISEVPVAREGKVIVRAMLPTSLTVDHRVINGIPAGQFIRTVNSLFEYPERIELGI